MDYKKKNIWIIGGIIFSYIVLLAIIIVLAINLSNTNKKENNTSVKSNVSSGSDEEEEFKNIRINEDYSTDGRIENLEDVRWNNARIIQNDGQMEFSVMLNNESKDKKIGKQNLKVILLDKAGKEIVSKDVNIKGIDANYGYTDIEFTIDMKELVIVDEIKIVAYAEKTNGQ